ncbi:MAG: DNA mismatch endonuclease Vsr [Planctomycetes bacterium]|nr:DNA mismatch endonuclease Vsr [Planctomycetota bacterium]MCC7169823.1 DNA mismatch endonuclease Vsr [Planctomycetota bacterium]
MSPFPIRNESSRAGLRVRGRHRLLVDDRRSELMSRVRRQGTTPELAVEAALRRLRRTFARNDGSLPGSPDFSSRRARWVVFVHGCFWHRHDGCRKTTTPVRNRRFWLAKFRSNRARDRRVTSALRLLGFRVVVVWECETTGATRVVVRVLQRGLR